MGCLYVFVALSQNTLPGTAMLPISRTEQELFCSAQETIKKQTSEFLMFGTANDLCCDGCLSDSFYDRIREDLFVDAHHSCVVVEARLWENITFWQNISVSNWLLRVIRGGYCLPFVELPKVKFFFRITGVHYVMLSLSAEISKLLKFGTLVEVSATDLLVWSPLGIAMNSLGKLRLNADWCYANQHLQPCKFKYEDMPTRWLVLQIWLYQWTSPRRNFPEQTKFLGCSWMVNRSYKFF